VIDDQLRVPLEQLRQRLGPVVGVEAVLLVDPHPWQIAPLRGNWLAGMSEAAYVGGLTGLLRVGPATPLAGWRVLLWAPYGTSS
jgi:hypothetical protein